MSQQLKSGTVAQTKKCVCIVDAVYDLNTNTKIIKMNQSNLNIVNITAIS